HVREESDKAQDGDDLELYLTGLVRHSLGHRMQPEEQDAEHENGKYKNKTHDDHEHVCLTGSGDEGRKMVWSSRVKGLRHIALLAKWQLWTWQQQWLQAPGHTTAIDSSPHIQPDFAEARSRMPVHAAVSFERKRRHGHDWIHDWIFVAQYWISRYAS